MFGEGYVKIFKELMEIIDWDFYGIGCYEKCVDCMVYCGYEFMVVMVVFNNLLKVMWVLLCGIKILGLMVLEIDMSK